MAQQQASSPDHQPGLIAGAAAMVKNICGLLFSRIELASLELAEVRAAALKLAVVFALGMIAAWFAIIAWTALLIALLWDSMGLKIVAIVAAVFTAAMIGAFLYARAMIAQGKLSMPATMAELRNDCDALL